MKAEKARPGGGCRSGARRHQPEGWETSGGGWPQCQGHPSPVAGTRGHEQSLEGEALSGKSRVKEPELSLF